MQEENVVQGQCPRCGKVTTLRVDTERNLMRCDECGLWFEY